jgi:hypothetical protein
MSCEPFSGERIKTPRSPMRLRPRDTELAEKYP